ncbi:MAG: flagellar biosynthesis anti-sigma factor FlgM [Bacteriovoracaceae bacterium]|nr:flagellar biosynthesis anti-sigma factor FlgM [Bacteriovoracaceae bacterium]
MSKIDSTSSRSIFLPNKRESSKVGSTPLQRNTDVRRDELEAFSKNDSKVDIPDAIKDFSRIKKVADAAPAIDNTEKIARLKSQIAAGTYKVDADALADKILEQEF